MEGFDSKKDELLGKLRWLRWMRFLGVSLLFGAYAVLREMSILVFPLAPFFILCFAEAVLNQPYPFFVKFVKDVNKVIYATLVMDVLLISGIVHYLGGIEFSFFSATYPMIIILASMLLGEDASFKIATISATAYMTVIAFEYMGVISHIPVLGLEFGGALQLAIVLVNVLFFYLIAYVSNYSSGIAKEKKDEASRAKEYMEAIIGNMREGLIILDKNGVILNANAAAERVLKYQRDELVGASLADALCNPNDRLRVEGLICGSIKGETASPLEICFLSKGREEVPLRITCFPVVNAGGQLVVIMVLHDVSEEKSAETIRSEFLSNISCELYPPLTAIKGFTSTLLSDKEMTEGQRQQYLEIVKEESERLENIIRRLTSLSRLESGGPPLNRGKADIGMIIKKVIEDHKGEAALKKILLQIDLPEVFPLLYIDEESIEQTVSHLLMNAIKYTPEGGKVRLELEDQKDAVKVSVIDTGAGIPSEDLHKIFNKYYRLSAGKKDVDDAGLELPMIKKIVEAHGGMVSVESLVGEGSKFSFSLPKNI
jgi:PAS domain S-box-containing protein